MDLVGLKRFLAPLQRRVMLMVGRCVLTVIKDADTHQLLQVVGLGDEVLDNVERIQEYGFTSVPFAQAEGILLALGGNRGHSVVIGCEDRRYRLVGLKGGEVAIYDDQGQKVHLKRSAIELNSPHRVDVIAPDVEVTADTVVVDAPSIDLGGEGGPPVARIGDMVQVGAGSSAGTWPIISGSSITRSN
jgi:phage baseplate assembly protein V